MALIAGFSLSLIQVVNDELEISRRGDVAPARNIIFFYQICNC